VDADADSGADETRTWALRGSHSVPDLIFRPRAQAFEYLEAEVLPMYVRNEGNLGYRMVMKLSTVVSKLRRTNTMKDNKTASQAFMVSQRIHATGKDCTERGGYRRRPSNATRLYPARRSALRTPAGEVHP
jgi:hypothetical protein